MQPPVKYGDAHCYLSSLGCHGLVISYKRIALQIVHGLGNTPEQNTNPNAGTKQH